MQGRLGARGARAMGGRRVPADADHPPRRHARGDLSKRGRGRGFPAPRATVLHRRSALRDRFEPRARRTPHALRLLPRPQWLRGRHERSHRGPDRALRTRIPRTRPRAHRHRRRGDGAAQPELRRRRHQLRGRHPAPDNPAADPQRAAPTGHPSPASTCAPPRRPPVAACTGCAARTPRAKRSRASPADSSRPRLTRLAVRQAGSA